MNTFEKLWPKFRSSKRYRDAFVAQHAKQEIGTQIRALLKHFNLTQTDLAKRAHLTQGVVSRAADPSNGNLTINTLVRIAAGFDVAFVGRFVPFSELPNWFDRRYEEPFVVPSFEEEDAAQEARERAQEQLNAIHQQALAALATANATRTTWDLLAPINAAFAGFVAAMARQLEATGRLDNPLLSGIIDTQQTTSPPQDNVLPGNFEQRAAQRKANRSLGESMPDQASPAANSFV